jgi:hypothetical protein
MKYTAALCFVVFLNVSCDEMISRVQKRANNICHFNNMCFQTRYTRRKPVTRLFVGLNLYTRLRNCSKERIEPVCNCFFNLGRPFGSSIELHFNKTSPNAAVIIQKPAILVDPLFADRKQYGHYSSKLLQVFNTNENGGYESAVFLRGTSHATCTTHLCQLERIVAFNLEIIHPGEHMICLKDATSPMDWERTFSNLQQWHRWRKHLSSTLGLSFNKCPPASIFILSRDPQHNSARKIVYLEEVGKALKDNGIPCFKHVYFNPSSSVKEQVQWFHRAGILIASHGSYFKNMMYAQPNSLFIEIASHERLLKHQPWAQGPDVSDFQFISSNGHRKTDEHCKYNTCGVIVNSTILAAAIQQGLQHQIDKGCDMRKSLTCNDM